MLEQPGQADLQHRRVGAPEEGEEIAVMQRADRGALELEQVEGAGVGGDHGGGVLQQQIQGLVAAGHEDAIPRAHVQRGAHPGGIRGGRDGTEGGGMSASARGNEGRGEQRQGDDLQRALEARVPPSYRLPAADR